MLRLLFEREGGRDVCWACTPAEHSSALILSADPEQRSRAPIPSGDPQQGSPGSAGAAHGTSPAAEQPPLRGRAGLGLGVTRAQHPRGLQRRAGEEPTECCSGTGGQRARCPRYTITPSLVDARVLLQQMGLWLEEPPAAPHLMAPAAVPVLPGPAVARAWAELAQLISSTACPGSGSEGDGAVGTGSVTAPRSRVNQRRSPVV